MAAGAPGAGLSSAVPPHSVWTARLLLKRAARAIWNVSVACAPAGRSFCFVKASFGARDARRQLLALCVMDVCSGKARVVILLLGEALALFLSEVERDALVDTL